MYQQTEAEIMKNWEGDVNTPIVSVCTITYNHEEFIAEAIESFLMQETTFSFEIVIDEDFSPDGTADVIEKYAKKYPNIIKENLREKNVGMMKNGIANMKRAKGKYIAFCEGDDYWTDPLKLQKQVDYLEKNAKYSVSFHDVNMVDDKSKVISKSFGSKLKDFTEDEMLSGDASILTGTALFRNYGIFSLFPDVFEKVTNGDMVLWHRLGLYGSSKYQEEIGNSSYRIHSGGVWSSIGSRMRIVKTIETLNLLKEDIPKDKYYLELRIKNKIDNFYTSLLYISLKKFDFIGYIKYLIYIIFNSKGDSKNIIKLHCKQICKAFQNKFLTV